MVIKNTKIDTVKEAIKSFKLVSDAEFGSVFTHGKRKLYRYEKDGESIIVDYFMGWYDIYFGKEKWNGQRKRHWFELSEVEPIITIMHKLFPEEN